jgi:putative phosphoesterase
MSETDRDTAPGGRATPDALRGPGAAPRVIGLVSDTHGMVRPSVHAALAGVELILHAGDVGDGVLEELAVIAPVLAVCGNTDQPGDPRLPLEVVRELDGITIHVSHGHETGSPTPAKLLARYPHDVLVYGHTHRQLVARAEGRLVVNPGAAGARRFALKPSVARLTIARGRAEVVLVDLD